MSVLPARSGARPQPQRRPDRPALWRFPGTMPVAAAELWIAAHLEPGATDWVAPVGARGPGELAAPSPAQLQPQTLERLAERAQQFTPRVSLVPPDGLLLEVKGSLHLFGGVEGLGDALSKECASMGLSSRLALAPTPLAAIVMARVRPATVMTMSQLIGQLTPLPLSGLRWPEQTLERLARMGVRTIGQALRLPRAGFARRFGVEQLSMLERLTGRSPDLRNRFQAREQFRRRREPSYELESHEAIVTVLAPVMDELGEFLQARQCGVMELECLLRHRHAPPTSCMLRLAHPVADARRLTELLGERLRMLVLPEPVRACELRSHSLVARALSSNHLWQPGQYGSMAGSEAADLVERLRGRLGSEAVYGLKILPSHRPENAWGVMEPAGLLAGMGARGPAGGGARSARGAAVSAPWAPFRRPAWLLPVPRLLSEREGLPRRRGPLRLLSEPERIETGWWDGGGIARDYYTAMDIHGVRLWIFRERAVPHRWFLHGVFG